MLGSRSNKLQAPPQVAGHQSALELARIWLVGDDLYVTLRPGVWEDPAAWGLLLVDLAKHAANTYDQSKGRDIRQTLNRIKDGFDAEWKHATDRPTGDLR